PGQRSTAADLLPRTASSVRVPVPVPEPAPPAPAAPPSPSDSSRREPTAEGDLGRTPFAHLLIYMLDKRLTGTTVFETPEGFIHSAYFHEGAPAKIRTGTMVAPLDRVLVELGLLDAD